MQQPAGTKHGSILLLERFNKPMLLLILWIIIQALLLQQNGIVTTQEAEKYIFEAQYFLENGQLTSGNYWLYSTQIFLIAIAVKLHLELVSVVIFQLLLNLVATWMFFKLAMFLLKNNMTAFFATVVFMINIPYQVYNSFLFTESIFYSLTIIYSSYLLRQQKLTIKRSVVLLLLLIWLSVTRPTGILFFGATAFYVFFRFLSHIAIWKKLVITGSALLVFLVAVNAMLQAGGSLDFMLPFKKENIICGVNTTAGADIETAEKGNSLGGILYYIANNKTQFIKLCKLKTIAFFGLLRSYYSSFHNIYLALFFYPFYVLSIVGGWKMFAVKERSVYYLLIIILLYWITTLLTCDDWHNRFFLTISPFIFLVAFSAFTKRIPLAPDEKRL